MNVVDSSAWIEYFSDGPNAGFFADPVENTADLIVPTLCLYEVFKRILQQRGEGEALHAVAAMRQGTVVDFNATLAIEAAKLSNEEKLPMADSIILTTARAHDAILWTQDIDFKGRAGVRYRKHAQ